MNPLTIRFPTSPSLHLNLFGITPNQCDERTLDEILALPIEANDQPTKLGDHCEVIDGKRDQLLFEGDLSRCDYVGGGLTAGRIVVNSSVGDYLADKMSGGQIEVSGSAGRFACSSLKSGLVSIDGDCGPYAAAAAPGATRGMNGGALVIRGNCAEWLGERMRRGTVVVHGRTAAASASRLIAGTLVLCGPVDYPFAANMSRGTILMLGHQVVCTAPDGFTEPEHTELSFLRILLNAIAPHLPTALRSDKIPAVVFRSLGDRINRGQGEVIWINTRSEETEQLPTHA